MHVLYPHTTGRMSLSYSPDGKFVHTVGDNMMARRLLVGTPDGVPDTIELNYNAYDVASTDKHLAICGEAGSAELFNIESHLRIGHLYRSSLPLRSIGFSCDGEWAGITGDEACRIVNVNDITEMISIPFENVKHLTFHPVSPSVIAISTLDGVVRAYDMIQQSTLGEVETVVPSVTQVEDNRSTAAVWCPKGNSFALPTKTFDIGLIDTSDWLVAARFTNGHTNAITTCAWSPNGRYLASGGRDNQLLIWDVEKRSIIQKHSVEEVCEVRWHPHSNELSAATSKGQLYIFGNVIEDSMHPPTGGDPIDPLPKKASKLLQPAGIASNDLANSDNEEDESLFVSNDELAPEDLSLSRRARVENNNDFSMRRKRQKFSSAGLARTTQPQQVAFQSGSTPWINQKRYLCMTSIGYVWCVRQSSTHHSATITFFDQSAHREVHFHDNDKFDLAALTSQACIFANSSTGKVAVRFHSSMSDNWETQLDISIDQGVQCLALSSEVAVIFTKSGFMRTYTLFGTPLSVCGVGGGCSDRSSVVTSSAHGNEVLVIHQSSESYIYTFEDVAREKVFQGNLPLGITAGNKIQASFFSESGEPCVMDSSGVLHTLVHGRQPGQAKWTPVLGPPPADAEIRKRYWPLGVQDAKLLCVVLKGQQQYPNIPIPITDEIDLLVPGLPANEASYLVSRVQHDQLRDRVAYITQLEGVEPDEEMQETLEESAIELDKMLLRQFQLACQDKLLNRGLQIVQLIQTPQSLQAAAKVAAAYQLTSLATKIQDAIE